MEKRPKEPLLVLYEVAGLHMWVLRVVSQLAGGQVRPLLTLQEAQAEVVLAEEGQ